jgi:hypothetical protein
MFLMFDDWTWICIGVTLSMALLTIQLINFMSVKVQKFIFGRDIRTPTLNLANIFLNGSQNRVPGRNFARFLLILFIIWSLIIRTNQDMLPVGVVQESTTRYEETENQVNQRVERAKLHALVPAR